MERPEWLTKVVPAFVDPFLSSTGEWKSVLENCRNTNSLVPDYGIRRLCEASMADYHIKADLQAALNSNGCGTNADWDEVGGYIGECVAEQNGGVEAVVAKHIVVSKRNDIRGNCVKHREKNGLPIEF